MEIIRIPASYYLQLKYLSDEDFNIFINSYIKLCNKQNIKIEESLRWWLVKSMNREIAQMENKARAKKWWKRLEINLATLSRDTVAPSVAPSVDSESLEKLRPSKVKENNIKERYTLSWEKKRVLKIKLNEFHKRK